MSQEENATPAPGESRAAAPEAGRPAAGTPNRTAHRGKDREREARNARRLARKAKRQKSWGWRAGRFVFHLLWLPALLLGGLAFGLIIGYSVLGGEPPAEAFSRELWQHLLDIIYAEG